LEPQKLQHLCQVLILFGAVLVALGTYGNYYFGKGISKKKLPIDRKGAVVVKGDPNKQINIGNIERIDGDIVQNQQKTTVNIYNSKAEDIDPSIKSFFQMPRYETLKIKIGGTFRLVKSKVFLYSISPQLVDKHTILILKVANEDSDRVYFLDEPNTIPLTIYLKVMNKQYLITVESYDESEVQVRTYIEK